MTEKIFKTLKSKNYITFLQKPYDLNLIVIRGDYKADHFNCKMAIIYLNDNFELNFHLIPITSYPGNYWLDNPMQPAGCGIISEGQWRSCWQLGFHYQIPALVNTDFNRPLGWVRVNKGSRNLHRNNLLNLKVEKGAAGFNFHPVMDQNNLTVGQDSAGCIVSQYKADFDLVMALARKQISQGLGSRFTLTLIHNEDL